MMHPLPPWPTLLPTSFDIKRSLRIPSVFITIISHKAEINPTYGLTKGPETSVGDHTATLVVCSTQCCEWTLEACNASSLKAFQQTDGTTTTIVPLAPFVEVQ